MTAPAEMTRHLGVDQHVVDGRRPSEDGANVAAYDPTVTHTVVAELVANVAQVVAAVGDQVTATDTLVILESMKMEIPVLAEVSGTVSELAVKVGDVITEGDVIAVIDTGGTS